MINAIPPRTFLSRLPAMVSIIMYHLCVGGLADHWINCTIGEIVWWVWLVSLQAEDPRSLQCKTSWKHSQLITLPHGCCCFSGSRLSIKDWAFLHSSWGWNYEQGEECCFYVSHRSFSLLSLLMFSASTSNNASVLSSLKICLMA